MKSTGGGPLSIGTVYQLGNESGLIKQARTGDQGAFATLVEQHASRAYRLAYVIVGNHYDAEDVIQDAFVTAYRLLPSLRQSESFAPWLHRIVVNRAKDLVRLQQARRKRDMTAYLAASPPEETDPDESLQLRRAVADLPEPHRDVILLYYSGELTVDEVAAILGRPSGTIRRILSEAYAKLRHLLGGFVHE